MNLAAIRTRIIGQRGTLLAVGVVGLAILAAYLAANVLGQARELAVGTPPDATASPSIAVPSNEPTPTPDPTADPTPEATPETAPDPTPVPTPMATPDWVETAAFGEGDWQLGVIDVGVWNGGFVAVGTSWVDGIPAPRMWRSDDGHAWSNEAVALGRGVSPQVVAPLADGRLMILGTIGDDVDYWSDPARAAAWTSTDGVAWTPVPLPFGETQTGPIEFTAGARGLIATIDDKIWHSVDGSSWRSVYDAPRGTMVYGPVAGDEGWIVKLTNASLWTTTLLVSGDASTWHEVDLGNVATVANVGGDWLASRQSDDWERTEVLRSANGLDWSPILDLGDLTPPEGTELTANGAILSGTDDVLVMSPWEGGHCGAMPSNGWGAWWSTDGLAWASAGIGDDAVVSHTVQAGEVTVLAGYRAETGDVTFWVSTP